MATPVESSHFLRHALLQLRWGALAALLVVALLVPPREGRFGIPTWLLLVAFTAYAVLYDIAGRRLARRHFFRWMALLDLPVAGVIYALGTVPGSLPFILLLLAVICAAIALGRRAALLYTAVAIALVSIVNPTLHYWSPLTGDLQEFGSELIVLGIVGVGAAALARRLELEHREAQTGRAETTRLTDLDRQRADFIATVSHELQTPLTAVRAGLGLLAISVGAGLEPDEQELLAAARRNTDRLRTRIGDLLTANQLDAGAVRVGQTPLDLRGVVLESLEEALPLFQEKGQHLEADLPLALPVRGDPLLLEQVARNLLVNAHRHTPADTRITVSGAVVGAEVRLTVRDTGPGIPTEDLEAIFARFHQRGASGGSGLGLAIARRVVELHGGRLWAENREGGAVFHVALPRDERDVAEGERA